MSYQESRNYLTIHHFRVSDVIYYVITGGCFMILGGSNQLPGGQQLVNHSSVQSESCNILCNNWWMFYDIRME